MGTGADGVVAVRRFGAWGRGVTDSKVTADLSALDDLALVRSFVDGERAAFDTIVARHQRAVYQVCYRFVRSHEDAADLTQDVFVRAFKGLKAFKGDAKLSTWLHRVAVNVCLNRAALVRPGIEPLDPTRHADDRSEDAFGLVARGERTAEVRRAIAQLPPKQRATVMLRVYQELSHEEIAEILGGTVGAAKANFFHALGNLKRMLES